MKATVLILALRCIFIALFAYAALDKLWGYRAFANSLKEIPIIGGYATLFVWIIPFFELSIVILLLLPNTTKLAFYISFLTMAFFTAYIASMIAFTEHLPCSCGGIISRMSWKQHLLFNIFFTALAISGLYIIRQKGAHQIATNRE